MGEKFLQELLINSTSILNDYEEIKKQAKKYKNCEEWVDSFIIKAGPLGAWSSLLGPFGEAADSVYLVSVIGKMCFGIGHIKNKPVDYTKDMEGILAIWSGSAKGITKKELKNRFNFKYKDTINQIYNNKLNEFNNRHFLIKLIDFLLKKHPKIEAKKIEENLFKDYISLIKVYNKFIIDDTNFSKEIKNFFLKGQNITLDKNKKIINMNKIKANIDIKILSKKISSKILAKGSVKLGTKTGMKLASKILWVISAPVCAGINIWILETFSKAAQEYYDSDYLILENEYSQEIFFKILKAAKISLGAEDVIELINS